MAVAILTVHASNGPWVTENGYEYNAVLIAAAFALAGAGPGEWSIDYAVGWDLAGTDWAIGALALGLAGALGAVVTGRALSPPAPAPTAREAAGGRFARGNGAATAEAEAKVGAASRAADQERAAR